jgi:tryptophan 2,3-dioxygenase
MIALQKESRELLEQNHEKQLLLTKNEQKIADYDRIHEAYAKSNMQKMAAETETQRLRQEKEQAEQNYRALEQYAREQQNVFAQKINSLETMTPREFRKYKKQLKKGE